MAEAMPRTRVRAQEEMERLPETPAARSAAVIRETDSVERLRTRWPDPIAAGQVIEMLLRTHPDYLEEAVGTVARADGQLAILGPIRSVGEHLDAARSRWDAERAPMMSGRHVVLALGLEPGVGWRLLQDGVVGSLLTRWRPGLGTPEEPHRLVWDVLSDSGRALAEKQPLLAAAVGAPAEATLTLPSPVRAMAWSPSGDRLAVLAGDDVYETRPGTETAQPLGTLGTAVESIGWGAQGVVGLAIDGGAARLLRAADGNELGDWAGVSAGVLSGDGSHAWLRTADGVYRWSPIEPSPTMMTSPNQTEPAIPVAVDRTGYHGLLRLPKNSVLVVAPPGGSLPGPTVGMDAYWPADAAPMVSWGPPRSSRCALVKLGGRVATVEAAPDGLTVWHLNGVGEPPSDGSDKQRTPQVLVCRIAIGASEVSALAVDPSETMLAVATGAEVAVWSLTQDRASSAPLPAYHNDQAEQSVDLLDADRDVQAIAALASARDIRPPLSIGLFGAWGSGKSFILDRVTRLLTEDERPEGYLRHIRVVRFNAWQYAEANLWASLVDEVLQAITPLQPPASPPEVTEAAARADAAASAVHDAAEKVSDAETRLVDARDRLVRQRRHAALLGTVVLLLAAVAVVAVLLGGTGRLVAAVSAALALLSAASGALSRAWKAAEQARALAEAGRSGIATLGQLLGRPEELAVQATAAELRRLQDQQETARGEADRLAAARDRVTELAREQPLGALLHRLATISEYRDQLSLVTRTRDHFQAVDDAIRRSREQGAEPELERVVIVIDDLDRCPPEKVVSVLEAVHLLFGFEMFVVLIAVDTRWLEQSLRIRYRQLLGEADSASPSDYLEKIIQIPLHLRPLSESMVRTMIAGLAGGAGEPVRVVRQSEPDEDHSVTADAAPEAQTLTATVPRIPPEPLPAAVLAMTAKEAAALSDVASLVGTTPRLVKRFINTYRLLKARSVDPRRFDEPSVGSEGGLGEHEVVAFLLAVVTGRPAAAWNIVSALLEAPPGATAEHVLAGLSRPEPSGDPVDTDVAVVRDWLTAHRAYADAPAQRFASLATEVARFAFGPPGRTGSATTAPHA